MDDSTLKQTLRAIGQEAVPDNWNRWDEIQRRVQGDAISNRRALSHNRWLKRVAVLLVVMLVSTGAIYAFVQMPPPRTGDTGVDGVKVAGLVTDLNLVQTIDGVQVQLNWAYIDEGRAILSFETFLVDADGARWLADADEPAVVRLSERNGLLPDLYPNRFDSGSYPKPVTVAFNLIQQNASLQGRSATVDLRFEVAYVQRPVIRNAIEKIFFSQIRRSTFGWAKHGVRVPLPPDAISFEFDFTLPVQHTITLEPMLTATASDIELTLESISVSPSKTDYRLCFDMPDDRPKGWHLSNVTLKFEETVTGFGGMEGDLAENGRYCTEGYLEVFIALPSTLVLTVEALERIPYTSADELLLVQREMNASGIEMDVEIHPDGTTAFTWPSNTEESQAVLVDLGYRIEGPWVFTIDVPAPDAE